MREHAFASCRPITYSSFDDICDSASKQQLSTLHGRYMQLPRSHHRVVVWKTILQMARTDLDTDRQGCSQVSASHSVGRFHVVLPHKVNSTTTVPVNFNLTYPAQGAAQYPVVTKSKKPFVLLLNGASVESFWYQRVIEELAKKGFVIAASDYYRPFHYKTPVLPSKFPQWCKMVSLP